MSWESEWERQGRGGGVLRDCLVAWPNGKNIGEGLEGKGLGCLNTSSLAL
jgi:hypothetical protein